MIKKVMLVIIISILATTMSIAKTLVIPITQTTYVSQKKANQNFGTDNKHLILGYTAKKENRIYLGGIPLVIIPKKAKITRASLYIFTKSPLKKKQLTIDVKQITKKWSAEKIVYNNQPPIEESTGASFVLNDSTYYIEADKGRWYKADITKIVKSWTSGGPTAGLALIPGKITPVFNKIHTATTAENEAPYLEVEFE